MKPKLHAPLRMALTATLITWLFGCASTGQNFDESKVSLIKKGETTEAWLIESFGKPENRGMNSEGETTLTWFYAETRAKGENFIPHVGQFIGGHTSSQKTLTVNLGPDGKVTRFSSSAGGTETRSNQVQDVPKK